MDKNPAVHAPDRASRRGADPVTRARHQVAASTASPWARRLRAFLVAWLSSVRLQIGAMAGTYGLAADVYLLLHIAVGERLTIIAAVNNLAHWVVLGSVTSCLVALLAPHRRFWVTYTLPGVIAFVAWYGVLYVPDHWLRSADIDLRLTVATYNVAHVEGGVAPTGDVIRDMEPDLLGLQEADSSRGQRLIANLDDLYPYRVRGDDLLGENVPPSERPNRVYTYALLSKYPILTNESQFLAYKPHDLFAEESLVGIRVVVEVDGQPVSVYVAHPLRPDVSVRPLSYDDHARKLGIRAIADALRDEVYPAVVLCDCNFSPQTDDYSVLAGLLTDAWQEHGFGMGLTAPADPGDTPLRLMRSDYIWYSAAFTTLQVKVWPDDSASDHRPVWAELGLDRPDP